VPAWISVTVPGELLCDPGMSSEGVTLACQEIHVTCGVSQYDGFCPEHLLYRKLLESSRAASVVADVSAVLQQLYTNGGEAVLISWPSGHGACSAVFEIDGDVTVGHGFTVRQPDAGLPYLIQTNQFYQRLEPESSARYDRIENYFQGIITEDNPPLTVDDAWEILGQAVQSGSVLAHASFVFEPDQMLMHMAFGEPGIDAPFCRHTTLNVRELLD
jgi:hypothetical protein